MLANFRIPVVSMHRTNVFEYRDVFLSCQANPGTTKVVLHTHVFHGDTKVGVWLDRVSPKAIYLWNGNKLVHIVA